MLKSALCVLASTGLVCLAVSGCSGTQSGPTPVPVPAPSPTPASKIQHIVIIMQENRSFDNLFHGFPGADTVDAGMSNGTPITLRPMPLAELTDLDHTHTGWWRDWDDGKMDGFSHAKAGYPTPNLPYTYVQPSDVVPYWSLAKAYTLGDRMFQSNTGPSFTAHQYMIAGQSQNADENPDGIWGCDATSTTRVALLGPNGTDLPGVFPCFDYQTMADNLDAKGITWRYYAPALGASGFIWSAFQAIHHIRFGADWTSDVVSPETQVLTDIANGQLAQVTWIVPSGAFSDHAGGGLTAEGPDWVASIVNEIGANKYWASTAIFISWDDWGGWYDHVVPPQVDAMGLGFRVPLIVVSPYAKHGYVSHQSNEFSGFLKYTEEVFGVASLGQRDVAADDFADCFDYTQTPQSYVPIAVTFTPQYFKDRPASGPPDND